MADSGSGSERHTGPENGLQRQLSISKELQDRIYKELDTLNTQATKINEIEKGLDVRSFEVWACTMLYYRHVRRKFWH